MRTITLEEHYSTPEIIKTVSKFLPHNPTLEATAAKLVDIGSGRIAAMDAGSVDLQVLSVASLGIDKLDAQTAGSLFRDANDQLHEAVKKNPTRLQGFASVDLRTPPEDAREIERCITKLGFKGVLLDGMTGGAFLDDPRFTPIFDVCNSLKIPIYLHPAPPPEAVFNTYFTGLPDGLGQLLSIAGWGWHVETGLHVLRLIVSGLFDRYPDQQIIIGHMGENLPFSLARSASVLGRAATNLKRPIVDYFHQNIHVTTAGYFTQPPFLCALQVVGADRLLYSVDYPFSDTRTGQAFLEALPISPADRAKVSHLNAEALLKLPAQR